jgi:chromosome segregation ATPase
MAQDDFRTEDEINYRKYHGQIAPGYQKEIAQLRKELKAAQAKLKKSEEERTKLRLRLDDVRDQVDETSSPLVAFARVRLESMGNAPRMYALKREAYMTRVETILEMALKGNFDWLAFDKRHMKHKGPACLDLEKDVEEEWARKVIADAIGVLGKE